MRHVKNEKIREAIKHTAAEFLGRISNRTSLITVTRVLLSTRADKATVLITVYPEKAENAALEFARRNAGELREQLGKRFAVHRLPFISFALDAGEKNRQNLDRLSNS